MDAIHTPRLLLRNFRSHDAHALHLMILRYQASPMAAYDHRWPCSQEEIKKVADWFASGDDYLAVCLREEGELIGLIALNPHGQSEGGHALNLGYIFDEAYHGCGYATEACRASLDRAFGELGAERVLSGTHPHNTPSVRLLARLGFGRASGREDLYELTRGSWRAGGDTNRT